MEFIVDLVEIIFSNYTLLIGLYLAYLWIWKKYWGISVLSVNDLAVKMMFTLQYLFQPFWIFISGYLVYRGDSGIFVPLGILLLLLPKFTFVVVSFLKLLYDGSNLFGKVLISSILLIPLYLTKIIYGNLYLFFDQVIFIIAASIYFLGSYLIFFSWEKKNNV